MNDNILIGILVVVAIVMIGAMIFMPTCKKPSNWLTGQQLAECYSQK